MVMLDDLYGFHDYHPDLHMHIQKRNLLVNPFPAVSNFNDQREGSVTHKCINNILTTLDKT